jgi:TetR/AcrR family transcriptional regulator, regulator of autoinduction and epiphytic fitness
MKAVVKRPRRYNTTLREDQTQLTRQRILDAARRLLVSGGYTQTTMQELARDAGVAYQTVYSQFGNKAQLAHELIAHGFPHVSEVVMLLEQISEDAEPETWLGTVATFARRLHEPCADLHRFMRQSGDPELIGRYREVQTSRLRRFTRLGHLLERSGRLRHGLKGAEAIDVMWTMTSPETYEELVLDRRWTPQRYEEWLAGALVVLVLAANKHPTDPTHRGSP